MNTQPQHEPERDRDTAEGIPSTGTLALEAYLKALPKPHPEILTGKLSKFSYKNNIYFVATGECLESQSGAPCTIDTLKTKSFNTQHSFGIKQSYRWGMSHRILGTIKLSDYNYEFSELIRLPVPEDEESTSSLLRELHLPIAKVYIYCAPCACAIATSLELCSESQYPQPIMQFLVRPDARLRASCAPQGVGYASLAGLIEELKRIERAKQFRSRHDLTENIDRIWVEQQLYRLEESAHVQNHPGNSGPADSQVPPVPIPIPTALDIFAEIESIDQATCAGIVIIGEVGQVSWIMSSPPFPALGRLPKETEIYHLKKEGYPSVWGRTFLGSYNPRAPAPRLMQAATAQQSSVPIPITTQQFSVPIQATAQQSSVPTGTRRAPSPLSAPSSQQAKRHKGSSVEDAESEDSETE